MQKAKKLKQEEKKVILAYAQLKLKANRLNKELDTLTFLKLIKEKASELGIDEKFLSRQLNVGFSGGEKKKNEILQMKLLQPKLSILDETDSGLDIDALRIVALSLIHISEPTRLR